VEKIRCFRLVLGGLLLSGALAFALPLISWRPRAGQDERAAPEKSPGLRLTLESLDAHAATAKDFRAARLAALYVPAGDCPSPFLPPGPFRATWEGELTLDLKGEYTFSAAGRGKLLVQLNGQTILDLKGENFAAAPGKRIELKRGANPLLIRYESPAEGDAHIRVLWASSEFFREPVSFVAVRHDAKNKELIAANRLREGRELLTHFHCLQCHTADTVAARKSGGMPELAAEPPSLADIGARINENWLAHWIANPQALRPTATMPKLFPTSDKGIDPRARDIAAYLATLGKHEKEAEKSAGEETVHQGGRLFAHLGCIACHLPPGRDDLEDAEHQRIPLRFVGTKWKPAALRAFLRQPDKHYPWIRMPNFHLSEEEISRLAAFLLAVEKKDLSLGSAAKPDSARGRHLLETTGCLNCHALTPGQKKAAPHGAASLERLAKEKRGSGCLDLHPSADRKAPLFALTAEQRNTLADFLSRGWSSLTRDSAVEFAERQIRQLRCDACHKRDGQDDRWTQLKEEADALLVENPGDDSDKDPNGQPYPAEQVRPSLTWTGEKLRPEWLTTFVAGEVRYKPRPFLRARMPSFSPQAARLARGLALEHGYPPISSSLPSPDLKRAEIGRQLASKKAWNCAGCHNIGKSVAESAFEAPGVNFMHVKDRLNRDYFERWLWSPLRVEPGTKMPSAYQPGKPSAIDNVLDGDAGKQIDALWQYLLTGVKINHPDS